MHPGRTSSGQDALSTLYPQQSSIQLPSFGSVSLNSFKRTASWVADASIAEEEPSTACLSGQASNKELLAPSTPDSSPASSPFLLSSAATSGFGRPPLQVFRKVPALSVLLRGYALLQRVGVAARS